MKSAIKVASVLAASAFSAQAAITISGTLAPNFKDSGLLTNIPTGSLAFLVADIAGDGFLNASSSGAVVQGAGGLSGKTITPAQAGLTVGSTFGGDTIVSIATVGASGSISSLMNGVNLVGNAALGKNFALVFFTNTAATVSGSLSGQFFGMIRGADWTLPATDSGQTFTLSATDVNGTSSYFSVGSTTITNTQITGTPTGGFFTGTGTSGDASTDVRGATFQIVPEPSAALLGAIGALGLLRRRRI